jgi:HAD superfamily hydrolase (TIGR01549 family)
MASEGKKVKMLIFDFDGTIADTFSFLLDNFDEVVKLIGAEDKIKRENIDYYRGLSMREFFKELGFSKAGLIFKIFKLQKELHKYMNDVKIYPGVGELIKRFNKEGYILCIVTSNSGKNVKKFLKNHSLMRYFEQLYSDPLMFTKDRKIKKLIKKYKLKTDEVLYIGDEVRDVKEAKQAGVKTISVSWGYNNYDALEKINDGNIVNNTNELYLSVINS